MPLKFAELLTYLEKESNDNQLVSKVCEVDCGKGKTYEDPTMDEVGPFLMRFAAAVRSETKKRPENFPVKKKWEPPMKDLAEARSKAIKQIALWVQTKPKSQFHEIEVAPFAFKLALRVRKPALIQQDATRMCGAVAVLATYGKTDPLGFATLGMNLLEKGEGTFFQKLKLKPSQHVLQWYPLAATKFCSGCALSSVDYVLLVSFRQCTDVRFLGWLPNVREETLTAGTICQRLEEAGYTDPKDHTFVSHGAENIKWAEAYLKQQVYYPKRPAMPGVYDEKAMQANLEQAAAELPKRFVLMQAHGDVAQYVAGQKATLGPVQSVCDSLDRLRNRHWTAVRKIGFNGNRVSLRLVTWGRCYEKEVLLTDLYPRYEGYVSASPHP